MTDTTGHPWQVLSTARRHLVDLDPGDEQTTPEQAVRAACVWNLDADGGFWFAGGVATMRAMGVGSDLTGWP